MNQNEIEGNWEQMKGKMRQAWGKLTDDDFALLKGNKQEFLGKVQEKHGIAQNEAEKQMKEFGYSDDHAAMGHDASAAMHQDNAAMGTSSGAAPKTGRSTSDAA